MDIIPNIYHFLYEIYNRNNDIETYIYLSIKSVIEICDPDKIYFHYSFLPSGKLWDKIKDYLTLIKIIIPKNNNKHIIKNFKNICIYNILLEYGGIYIDSKSLLINPIKNLLKYNFVKTKNNEIVCSVKNSHMANNYYKYYYDNIIFEEIYGLINIDSTYINNLLIEDPLYNTDEEYINTILFKNIYDYSFGDYFHLIKKCAYIYLNISDDKLTNINMNNILNNVTIYNLLIRRIMVYNKSIVYTNNKFNLINNIDIIIWLNLEKSITRKNKMINILNNFNIKNYRLNSIDGYKENNINTKCFILDNQNISYPNYCNKEYAILATHLNALEYYYKYTHIKYGYALICEDDLSLDFTKYWDKDIKSIIEGAPEDTDIIMLGYFSVNLKRESLYTKWDNEWSALAYLVNHKSLYKLNNLKKNGKWLCKEGDLMVSDNYIFSKFNTYVYKYPYFTFPDDNDSTFHDDHLNYHKIYKISNYITLENIYEEFT
jgi:hypothetical protein